MLQIPSNEVFEKPEDADSEEDDWEINRFLAARADRRRAKSINPLAMSQDRKQIELAVKNVAKKKTKQVIPTVFRYNLQNGAASISTVYIAGKFLIFMYSL